MLDDWQYTPDGGSAKDSVRSRAFSLAKRHLDIRKCYNHMHHGGFLIHLCLWRPSNITLLIFKECDVDKRNGKAVGQNALGFLPHFLWLA